MSIVRNALRIKDSRLMLVIAVLLVFFAIDFFGRVMLFSPASSRPDIEETVILSEAIPQIDQPRLDSYLSKIGGLIAVPTQRDLAQVSDDLAAQQLVTEPVAGFWRAGELSFKLVALVESAERFAVLSSLDTRTGKKESIELRLGDSIVGYTVSGVLAKELRLSADNGDQKTLALFEPEGSED